MVPTLIFLDFQLLFQQIQFRLHWTAASHSWGHFKVQNGSSKNAGLGVSGLWAVFVIGLEVSKSRSRILKPGVSQSRKVSNLPCYTPIPQISFLELSLARSRLRFYLALPVLVAFISFISRDFKITTVVIIQPKILLASAM